MGQATRTTKLLLQLGKRDQGGANTDKQAALSATVELLNRARAFYIDFFLAHADKLAGRVLSYSEEHLEMRERAISANELLSWAETCTVETEAHPHPSSGWNFSARFPDLPFIYRRSEAAVCAAQGLRWQGVAVGELSRGVQPLLRAAAPR